MEHFILCLWGKHLHNLLFAADRKKLLEVRSDQNEENDN